jgi:Rad3-related DNA helicase
MDRKISAMKQRDPKWYTWNTILRLIQAYGRSIRSKDDHAMTYILDSSITYLLRDAKDMLPKWFSDAIVHRL